MPVTSAPASTGLLLEGNSGIYQLPIAGSATLPTSNLLTAVTDANGHAATANTYVLAKKQGTIGFYLCKTGVVVPPGKAYLTAGADSREFFTFEETTGISDAMRLKDSEKMNSVLYNLNGQRLQVAPRKGIYIKDGRKNVIK